MFLKHALMKHGSLWGHGAYLGPDYTAEHLHLEVGILREVLAESHLGPGGPRKPGAPPHARPCGPVEDEARVAAELSGKRTGASASRLGVRARVVPTPSSQPDPSGAASCPKSPKPPPSRPPRRPIPWAKLLKRTFRTDVLCCPRCRGTRRVVAVVLRSSTAQAILEHLRLPSRPLPLAPATSPPQLDLSPALATGRGRPLPSGPYALPPSASAVTLPAPLRDQGRRFLPGLPHGSRKGNLT